MSASLGIVKWFGGYNNKTQSENKYGFLEDVGGADVFLHQHEWRGASKPRDGEILTYTLKESDGKWSAKNASDLTGADYALDKLLGLLKLSIPSTWYGTRRLRDNLKNSFSTKFSSSTPKEKVHCLEEAGKDRLIDLLDGQEQWYENITALAALNIIEPIQDIPWDRLPERFIDEHAVTFAQFLLTLEISEARRRVDAALEKFSPALIMLCILADYVSDEAKLNIGIRVLDPYIRKIYLGSEKLPVYLSDYIDAEVKPKGGVRKNLSIGHLFDYYLFKKYLYEKDLKFVGLYEDSDYLKSRLDIFILVKIFSLLLSGNTVERVYELFMGALWGAITSGLIQPTEQQSQQHFLFPSCSMMPDELSCEAVYWSKREMYLCRGRQCVRPQVVPDMSRSYFNFTAYDWFAHYGIAYLSEKAPSSRDFPIKLAAYFNRLQEIYSVIHCRSCQLLMLPDMRYSRVEYTTVENGQFVKKDMAASYRLTVFKCTNSSCTEHNKGCYINHCFGFDCYDIIDSRDCKTKCDAGRYICKGCGSCCGDHDKKYPVGLCPDCGTPLKLFESSKYDSYRERKERFVKCENLQCDFNIPADKLSKRFYQDSCGPVHVLKQ